MLQDTIALLEFVEQAKELVEKDAPANERKDFIKKVGVELLTNNLDTKSKVIAGNYINTIKDIVDPDTSSSLRGEAIKTLGILIADKLDLEHFENMDSAEAKSAMKVLGSLKGLVGVVDLIKHNEDPTDPTAIKKEKVKEIALDLLDDFNLDDDAIDLHKEGKEFMQAGKKLLDSIKEGEKVDALEMIILVQELIDEGYDVVRELIEAAPDIKEMVKYIVDGTKEIARHVKAQLHEMGDDFKEYGKTLKLIHAEHMSERLKNKLEANDGDGYKDGKWNHFKENAKSFGEAVAKGWSATGHLFKNLIMHGHDDDDVTKPVNNETTTVDEAVVVTNLINNESEEIADTAEVAEIVTLPENVLEAENPLENEVALPELG